jgi:Phage ABA sandwich domain
MTTDEGHSREQICALPAGRELDALIAERVMGLPALSVQDWQGKRLWHRRGDDRLYTEAVPYYSTDIAAAWQVVECIHAWAPLCGGDRCDHFSIDAPALLSNPEPPALWAVGWHDYAGGERICSLEATADTVPLAVCRAALLALLEGPDPRDRMTAED